MKPEFKRFPVAGYHLNLYPVDAPAILPVKVLTEAADAMQYVLGGMVTGGV